MKKIYVLFLSVIFIVCFLFGCDSSEEKYKSINDFLEEYKRSDISLFENNPEQFIDDFLSAAELAYDTDLDGGEWVFDESMSGGSTSYFYIDGILFSYPAEITVSVPDEANYYSCDIAIRIETGENEKDVFVSKSICEELFKKYGDPSSISVYGEDATENKLRSEWNESEPILDYRCHWSDVKESKKETEMINIFSGRTYYEEFDMSNVYISISIFKFKT